VSVPAVSVVLPVRDAATTLDAAVESIRAQTDRDWELIAIDDGSTDDSLARLRAQADDDERIQVVATPARGLVAALNTGLDRARGRFVARMDADDLARPERLARQRARLEEDPALGLVATRVAFDGDRVRGAGYARYVDWTNRVLTADEIRLAAFVESPFAHPSVMFRREVVERHGRYAEGDFPEDYELWLRWLGAGVRMEKLPDALLVWRDHPHRLSRRDPRYSTERFDRLRAHHLATWLAAHNPHHPSVVVWGAGRESRRRAGRLAGHGVSVSAWIDIDARKIGRCLRAAPVLAPDRLPAPGECFVVSYVGSHGARDLIEARLRTLGYRPGAHYVLAA
jgi:glycosyltransferase involved in cell wall biosynthesis